MTNDDLTGDIPGEAPDRASLARALRDLEATQARVQQNAQRVYDEKRRELVMELLPVSDNLERTIEAAGGASDPSLIDGLRMVQSQLEGVLNRYGLERIDATDQVFDPALHEAVAAVPVSSRALVGRVLRQAAPGYRFGGRVLRAARVSVGVEGAPVQARQPRLASSRW